MIFTAEQNKKSGPSIFFVAANIQFQGLNITRGKHIYLYIEVMIWPREI